MVNNKVLDFIFKFISLTSCLFHCVDLNAQLIDSAAIARTKTSDSIKLIPLELVQYKSDGTIQEMDYNSRVLEFRNFFGLSTLNNYGSPTNFLKEERNNFKYFNNGFHSLDFFQCQLEEISFYKSNKTYAELMISQAAFFANSQTGLIDNLNAGAFLSKNFANNIDLNVSYDRINQKGIYVNSRNLLGSLNASVRYLNTKSRWSYYLSYFNQLAVLQHSSGIFSDTILDNSQYQIREAIPVRSSYANTRISGNQYRGQITYQLKKDSSFFNPKFEINLGYKTYFNVMEDPEFRNPNTLYGLPLYNDTNQIERAYFQYTFPVQLSMYLFESEKLKMQFNISNENNHLVQDSIYRFDVHSIVFGGKTSYNFSNNEIVLAYALKSQEEHNGNHVLLNCNNYGIKNIFLQVGLFSLSQIPAWMTEHLYVNKRLIWDRSLKNVLEQGVKVNLQTSRLYIPTLQFQLSSIKNLLYLDSEFNLNQGTKRFNFMKLELSEDIIWKWIGLKNQFKYIQLSPDSAGWTSWYSKHELYLRSGLFKRTIPSKLSVVAEFASPGNINGFNSIVGMYYPFLETGLIAGPFIGLHLEAQVSDLIVSINFDHLDSFWNTKRPVLIQGYPVYDFGLEIKLHWKFTN